MLVATVVASFAALSARPLPGMTEWPGIHWMKMEDKMELMELRIKEVRGFDEMRASHNDLLSVQKSMEMVGVEYGRVWWCWLMSMTKLIPWQPHPPHPP